MLIIDTKIISSPFFLLFFLQDKHSFFPLLLLNVQSNTMSQRIADFVSKIALPAGITIALAQSALYDVPGVSVQLYLTV